MGLYSFRRLREQQSAQERADAINADAAARQQKQPEPGAPASTDEPPAPKRQRRKAVIEPPEAMQEN